MTAPTGPIDKKAFEAYFREFFPGLCAFAQKYLKDMDASKDIVHDVFVNFWNKRAEMDPNKAIKTYLFTSVHNRCLNYIRDNKKFDKNELDMERVEENSQWEQSDHLEQSELEAKVNAIIQSLPEKCREVFMMNRFDGLKYKEIADKLGISQKTVETQMSKALKVLREELKGFVSVVILIVLLYLSSG